VTRLADAEAVATAVRPVWMPSLRSAKRMHVWITENAAVFRSLEDQIACADIVLLSKAIGGPRRA